MKPFNKIAIIGVGLIGGSIGLAIKKKGIAREVTGIFRREPTLNKALKFKAIDRGTLDIAEGVRDADLIILATPVSAIPALALKIAKYAKDNAVITDAGSTKMWIVSLVERGFSRHPAASAQFVGSHPMAGSEHASVEFARADLLEGAPCIVTKTKKTDTRALKIVVDFWSALGARVKIMAPAEHDRVVSLISHLPHVVAFSLAGAVSEDDMAYAAEGFGDTTRVASSDPGLWADIFLSNRRQILAAGKKFIKYYDRLMKALAKNDYTEVCELLTKAKSKRDKFIYGKGA